MDMNTLLPLMLLLGGGSNNNMGMVLMLMMMSQSSSTVGTNPIGNILTPQAMTIGLLPGMGVLGKYMIGGAGAVLAGSLLKKKTYRRKRAKTVYINNGGYRRRYWRR